MAQKFKWTDGKARVHTRPQRTPEQLAKRRADKRDARKYANPIYDPTAPLAGKALGQAADALVGLEFGPQRKALDRESADTTRQGLALVDRAGGYYNDLAKTQADDVARQTAIGQRLQQSLQGVQDRSTAALDASAADVDRRAREDAATRGEGLGGGASEQLAAELAAQRAAAAADARTAQTGAAEGTADYERLADLTSKSTAQRGGEVRGELLNRLANAQANVRGRRADLEGSAAQKRSSQLVSLREKGFEDLVTLEGLGIKRQDLQAQIASDKADQALAGKKLTATERQNRRQAAVQRRGQNVTRRGQDISAETQRRGQNISAAQRRADRASRERIAAARKNGTKLESADAKKLKTGIVNAVSDIGSDPKLTGRKLADQARILRKRGAPAIVIRAATERGSGGLNADTAAELRRLGIRVPKAWLRGGSTYNKGKAPG